MKKNFLKEIFALSVLLAISSYSAIAMETVSIENQEDKKGSISVKVSSIRNNTNDPLFIIPEFLKKDKNSGYYDDITKKFSNETDNEYKKRIKLMFTTYKLTNAVMPHSSEKLNLTSPSKALDPVGRNDDFETREYRSRQRLFSERLIAYETTTRKIYTLDLDINFDYERFDLNIGDTTTLKWNFTIKDENNNVIISEQKSLTEPNRVFRYMDALFIVSYVINDPISDSIIDLDVIIKDTEQDSF